MAAEWSDSVEGQLRLESGLVAAYSYHFDRNAIADSRLRRNSLVALTESGNLLRFDLQTLKPTAERYRDVSVVCMGDGPGGEILVCTSDGLVYVVDPANLAATQVARVPSRPIWVGAYATSEKATLGLVVVAENQEAKEFLLVHDLARKRTHPVLCGTVFYLDSKQRLWIGADRGEWGGWCALLDLPSAKTNTVGGDPGAYDTGEDGVYGFVGLADGQVWAYGGMSHMGFNRGHIARVDTGEAKKLASFGGFRRAPEGPVLSGKPRAPVTRVLESGTKGRLLVFSYGQVFETDQSLSKWKHLCDLSVRYHHGRPDAMSSYPAVSAVHRMPGGQDDLLFATLRDGYVSLRNGKQTSHAVPNQLGLRATYRIEATTEGALLLHGWSDYPPWRLRNGTWEPFECRYPPLELDRGIWHGYQLLAGHDGTVTVISKASYSPGPVAATRWSGGNPTVLAREETDLCIEAAFTTPDGEFWTAWYGSLKRLVDGKWTVVGTERDTGWGLRAVYRNGPPWILFDHREKKLLRLTYGPDAPRSELAYLNLAVEVWDALDWTGNRVLLTTDKGLRFYDAADDRLATTDLPTPDAPPRLICRDGTGRLWMAGRGLWTVDPTGRNLESVAGLPVSAPAYALAPDPEHKDGVIVSLGPRGVIFIRVVPRERETSP